MQTDDQPLYHSSLLAKALRCSRENVLKGLRKIEPDGEVKVVGNRAKAWRLGSLPARWIEKLTDLARLAGYQTPREFVETHRAGVAVEPPRPSLTPTLYMASDSLTGQLVRPGAKPTPLHFKSFESAVRWSWENNCHFIMLHSGERGAVKLSKLPVVPLDAWRAITGGDGQAASASHPASRLIWLRSFERFEIEKERSTAKRARLEMIRFLWRTAPFLAKSEDALRVQWLRLHRRWVKGGYSAAALADGRRGISSLRAASPMAAPEPAPPVCPAPPTPPAPGVSDVESTYIAAELATELGISRQAVNKRLKGTPASVRMVSGNPANVWPLAALPAEWQAKLAGLRPAKSCGAT